MAIYPVINAPNVKKGVIVDGTKKAFLETREERVKLLKAGLTGKQIEQIYVKANGFKVVNTVLKEPRQV